MYRKYVISLLLLLFLIGPIGQFFLFKFTSIYDLNLKTNLYNNASWVKNNPKIAIMGSSHAKYQIIPREIAKLNKEYKFGEIVNIAQDAASAFEMYTTYKKNENKLKDLKYLFYTLEPHILGEKYQLYNDYEKIKLTKEQWDYLEKNDKQQNSYYYPFQTFVQSLQFRKTGANNEQGYKALKHKKFNTFSKGKVKKQLFGDLDLFPISKFQIEYLKKLKTEVEKNGTKFIFVLTPTYTWHNIYKQEAVDYDNQLVNLLNDQIGKSVVIGSFYPEDYMLAYEDFKDDTHLAHSGASKFTKEVFNSIEKISKIEVSSFKNTYEYKLKAKEFEPLDLNRLVWKINKDSSVKKTNNGIVLSSKNIKKSVVFNTSFEPVSNIKGIRIKILPSKEKLKMIAFTLRYKKEYAHFFIKSAIDKERYINLEETNISKKSKNFNMNKIDSLGIRVYPLEEKFIKNFKISNINLY